MNASEIASSIVLLGAVVGALALLWTKVGRKAWVGYRTARAKATAVGDAILGRDTEIVTLQEGQNTLTTAEQLLTTAAMAGV